MLDRYLPASGYVVELGSWLGKSARFILTRDVRLVCIDTWWGDRDSLNATPAKLRKIAKAGGLLQVFMAHCWDLRDRIAIVKTTTAVGLHLCRQVGLVPAVIYIDASHDARSVARDVTLSRYLFPDAILVGDDWRNMEVKKGVEDGLHLCGEAEIFRLRETDWTNDRAWSFVPGDFEVR